MKIPNEWKKWNYSSRLKSLTWDFHVLWIFFSLWIQEKKRASRFQLASCFLLGMKWHILHTILQISWELVCFLEIPIFVYQPQTLFGFFFFFLFTNTMLPSNWGAPQSWSICTDKIGTHWDFFLSRKPDTWGKTGSLGNHPGARKGFSWATCSLLPARHSPRGCSWRLSLPELLSTVYASWLLKHKPRFLL